MYPASVIAYAFVMKGIESGNPVTQMKLQKLVYFAHGIHLAMYGRPLISDYIQAWKYGPVVPAIYRQYKLYGADPIVDFFWFRDGNIDRISSITLDSEALDTINTTWDIFKEWNAVQLSNWTHMDDSPWYKYYNMGVSDVIIPNDAMKEYFKQFLTEA